MKKTSTTEDNLLLEIKEAILTGVLKPGEKINQDKVAEMFNVSRTPLRTVLTTLVNSGLVSYQSNKGFKVREFSIEEIKNAVIVRSELEGLACKLATKNISSKQIANLEHLLFIGDSILKDESFHEKKDDYRKMNIEFHTCLMNYAGNPILKETLDKIYSVPLISDRIILFNDRDILVRSHDDHHRIVRAIKNDDGTRAQNIMREHVLFAIEYMISHINESNYATFLQVSNNHF